MQENEEYRLKFPEQRIEKFVPSLAKIDQKYILLSPAVSATKVTKLLDGLDNISYTNKELDEIVSILFMLIDDIAKDAMIQDISREAEQKKYTEEGRRRVTGQDELLSIEDIKSGIKKLFNCLDNNTNVVSSPKDDVEREKLYSNLKKGFRYIAEIIRDEYINNKNMEPLDVYGNLDIIANASKHCAMRWNDTLSQLVTNFKSVILKRKDIQIDESDDLLFLNLKTIFFEARVIEVDKVAEAFIKQMYAKELKNWGEGNIPHYIWIFKKTLNDVFKINVPLVEAKDSYIEYGGRRANRIHSNIIKYMEDKDLTQLIFKRSCQILSDKIKTDKSLRDSVIDWGGKYFEDNNLGLILKDGKSQFLQECIFTDIFSYQIGEFAIREIMVDKGFIKEDIYDSKSLAFCSRDKINFEKLIRCLECMKRDGDNSVWKEIETKKEFFNNKILNLWCREDKKEELFLWYIENMPDEFFNDGYKILKTLVRQRYSANAMYGVILKIFKRGLIKYDESLSTIVDILLKIEINETIEDILKKIIKNMDAKLRVKYGYSLLYWSVENNSVDIVEMLMKNKSIASITDRGRYNLLKISIKNNSADITKMLLKKEMNFALYRQWGDFLLHLSVKNNNADIVEMLIKNNANVNAKNESGKTPIYLAIKGNYTDVVKVLINNNAKLDIKDENGCTIIYAAVHNNNIELVKLLISRRVNLNIRNKEGETPLHWATCLNKVDIIKILIENKAKPDIKNNNGETPIFWAVKNNYVDVVKILINNKVNLNIKNRQGETLLHKAVGNNNIDIASILIDKGLDVNKKNKDGKTPLSVAIDFGNINAVKLLLKNKADFNIKDSGQNTLIFKAVKNNNVDIVKILLDNGVEPNLRDNQGYTILDWAVYNSNTDMVNMLVKNKAKININYENRYAALQLAATKTNTGMVKILAKDIMNLGSNEENMETLLEYAVKNNYIDVVKVLAGCMVDLNKKDLYGRTPIYWAVCNNNIDIVKILVKNRAKTDITDIYGYTPLKRAVYNNNIEVVKLLKDTSQKINIYQYVDAQKANQPSDRGDIIKILNKMKENIGYSREL